MVKEVLRALPLERAAKQGLRPRSPPPPPCASTAAVPKYQAKQRFNAPSA